MKKTERIQLIMRYINNRAQFTISEIQKEFEISRATAIRDVQEIESLGFPLVTERGRNGGYFVLQNEYLPAVHFTPDELRAIFISFMASKNSQLPFLQNRKNIAEKLIAIAPQTQQDALIEMENLIFFDNTNPYNPSILELSDAAPAILNTIISQVIKSRNLTIEYKKIQDKVPKIREVAVDHIYNTNGNWYLDCYDYDKASRRNFRVDRVASSQLSEISHQRIASAEEELEKNLSLQLEKSAIERFKRQHPFGAALQFLDMYQRLARFEFYVDEGNLHGLNYIADWLLFLGNDVQIEKIPKLLAEVMKEKLLAKLELIKRAQS